MLLLCHAATTATRAAAFPADEPLDARGRAEAAKLAGRLPKARFILTSPARRAVDTVAATGLAAREHPALRDCDYGRWAGASLDDIAAAEPEAVALWLSDPHAAPHGGESIGALIERVAMWMDGEVPQGRTLAITHAAVIRAAVIHALGAPANAFWRIDAAPLSLIELRRNERRWSFHATELAGQVTAWRRRSS